MSSLIDVLVRCKDESLWLPQLLKSLQIQRDVSLGKILLIDNGSLDSPEDMVSLFPDLKIEVHRFNEPYLPGRMLNFGLRLLVERPPTPTEKILIVSAHCFLVHDTALSDLEAAVDQSPAFRAAYGRQVAMHQSDSFAVRDLALLYPNESRSASRAASFNNAFSLVSKVAFEDHFFDDTASNLEDVIWAAEEISKGFQIAYVAESAVAHHHGPHHGNSSARVESTRATIEKYKNHFHYSPVSARVDEKDILRIFITEGYAEAVTNRIELEPDSSEFLVWSHRSPTSFKTQLGSLRRPGKINDRWLRREAWNPEDSLMADLPNLHTALLRAGHRQTFVQLIDDSLDSNYALIDRREAADNLKQNYVAAIWPVTNTQSLYISRDKDGDFSINLERDSVHGWMKSDSYLTLRGNGVIFSRSALVAPQFAFETFDFLPLEETVRDES